MLLDKVIGFTQSLGLFGFIRVFWYFFVFEFFRFVLMDFIVVLVHKLNKHFKKDEYEHALHELWEEKPFVSVIVPGKNEGKHIYKLVKSMSEQTYQNFEIIVVDDGSDDQTATIGRSLERSGLISLFIRNEVRGGKASAANVALRFAKGKYVLHLDADSSFDRDAIEKILLPFYMIDNLAAVGGNLEVRNADTNICTTLQAIEYLKTITIGRMVTSYLGIYSIISGAFGMFRKDVLDKLNGWDIGPGLDGDITLKIRKMGYKVHFEPTANGKTNAPATFKVLSKQRLRWNKSIVRFRMRKHINIFFPNYNFNFMNFWASADNIFYTVIVNFIWYINAFDMVMNFSDKILYIMIINFFLFTSANIFQFLVAVLMADERSKKMKLFPYLPLMPFYNGYYMRLIKTMAHLKEMFFYSSYDDPWNPPKSSSHAKHLKL